VELAKDLEKKYPADPASPYGVHQVIRTRTPIMLAEIPDELIVAGARDAEHLEIIRALGLKSYMSVPLLARGQARGALTFVTAESGRRYTETDLQLAEDIAARAALAIDNAFAYEEARRASRIKDDFLATLSHELRTPLNAVLGYSRMLRAGLLPADRQAKALETIDRNARSLAQLVEDVLDISRIVAGKIRLDVQPVELPRVVSAAIASAQPAADAKGVRIHCVADPQTPTVAGDPDRLQQVVWNLLSNAVKFTPRGGRVEVRLERSGSSAAVQVSDTGVGIGEGFLPHVFERFRQADSRFSREHGGLGLGLAISREIVQMHGGQITAASDGEGKGATFRMELPIMIVQPRGRANEEKPPAASGAAPRLDALSGVRVLAVDDDQDALTLVSEILESVGATVITAPSAQDALAKLQREPVDVLVSDVGMPRMDGFTFIRLVREDRHPSIRHTPAAALTAYARSDDRTRALEAGFQMHLAKPIDPDELIAAVRRLAGGVGLVG
jgi:signal transduction histidine kinase/ActR/RegA family two-component response regulator